MSVLDFIRAKRAELYEIADRNKADKIYLFGSCARGEEDDGSDVDFLVRFREGASLLDQAGLINDLQGYLGRQVDVVSTKSLARSPRFASQVMPDLIAL